MTTTITGSNLFVLDQDESLAFYVDVLGFEVTADVDLGFMRWLTVSAPGQPTPNLVLCPLAIAPQLDGDTDGAAARALLAKGVLGCVFLAVEDVQAEFDRIAATGARVTQPVTEQPYGVDCAFADPAGNQVRIGQLTPVPA